MEGAGWWGRSVGMVAHLVALGFPGIILYVAFANYSFFSWHPIGMALAYAFLMNEAIQVFSPSSSLVAGGQVRKVNIHGYLLFSALICATGGFIVIYWNKSDRGKEHFTTWHGLIGLITVVYTAIQVVAGVFLKYAHQFKLPFGMKLVELKVYHGLSGCTVFLLASASLILGCYSNWFVKNTGDYLWGAGAIGAVLLVSLGVNHLAHIVHTKAPRLTRSR